MALAAIYTDLDNPFKGWQSLYNETINDMETILAPALKALQEGMGQGTYFYEDQEGNTKRGTNNDTWYSQWYKEHKRPPTKAELRELARQITFAESGAPQVFGFVPQTQEEYEAMQENKPKYERLEKELDILQKIKDRMQKINKTEISLTTDLSGEAYSVYRDLFDKLSQGPNKAATRVARMNAAIFARHADIFARIMREKQGTNYTAMDYYRHRFGLDLEGKYGQDGYNQSAMMSENKKYIATERGIDIGHIPQELIDKDGHIVKALPIRLQIGYQIGNAQGAGWIHILNRHADFFRARGYADENGNINPVLLLEDIFKKSKFATINNVDYKDGTGKTVNVNRLLLHVHAPQGKRDGMVMVLEEMSDDYTGEHFYSPISIRPESKSVINREIKKALQFPVERSPQDHQPADGAFFTSVGIKAGPKDDLYARESNAFNEISVSDIEEYVNMYSYPKPDDPNIYHQLAGEQGAANLDRAEEVTTRLDNFAVAREMETAGKDAKAIRLATGWERGADGKWRYEIMDGEVKVGTKLQEQKSDYGDIYYTTTLGEIFDAPDLFKAYPDLKTIQIIFQELPKGERGAYYPTDNNIVLSDSYSIVSERRNTARLIEIEATPEYKDYQRKLEEAEDIDNAIEAERVYDAVDKEWENTPLGKEYIQLLNTNKPKATKIGVVNSSAKSVILHEIQHAIQYMEGHAVGSNAEMFSDMNQLVEEVRYQKEKIREAENAIEQAEDLGYTEETPIDGKTVSEWKTVKTEAKAIIAKVEAEQKNYIEPGEKYHRTAGEVEARNVQERITLTEQQRRETLLAETEDVAREDQIFLREGVEYSANSMSQSETITPEQQAEQKLNADVKAWGEVVDKLYKKEKVPKQFKVMDTPLVMQLIEGVNNYPVYMGRDKFYEIRKEHPGMTRSIFKQIPKALTDPIFIFKSKTVPERIVVALELLDNKGVNVVVPFEINSENGKNIITSAYGRSEHGDIKSIDYTWFIDNINRKNTLYINRKKADTFLSPTRVQFPLRDDKKFIDFFGNSIKTEQDLVNKKIETGNIFYQQNDDILGSTTRLSNGQRIISLFENANESTFLHESGHLFLMDLEELALLEESYKKDLETVNDWANHKPGMAEEYKNTPWYNEFKLLDCLCHLALSPEVVKVGNA